jgi:hypothetical protein
MSKTEKESMLSVHRRQYAHLRTKKAKGRILDAYCELAGHSRKHAIKALSPKKPPSRRRGCPPGGTREGTDLLVKLWRLSDMLCGKLLRVVIPAYLESLGRHERVSAAACDEVLGMSASTMDRRLRAAKVRSGGNRHRRQSSLAQHRRDVPLKIDTWPEAYPKEPGWIEADTVAHCGGSMLGSFIWTLTMTDVGTGWTWLDSVWNKGAMGVRDAIDTFMREAPFTVRAFNSDNGSEFLNGHLQAYFAPLSPTIKRSRSRSWQKNDNAHVEQKNGVLVRGLFGYGRIDDPDLLPLMKRIDQTQNLIKNLFTPTMRLLSKERHGAKYVKRYEKVPKTPAQRVLESPLVSEEKKEALRHMIHAHDICDLKAHLDAQMRLLARRLNDPAGASGNTLQHQRDRPQPTPVSVSSHLTQPEPFAVGYP